MPIFIQYLLSFLGTILVISYGYGQWSQGRNQDKLDTISLLKSDVETLRGKVEELTSEVKNLIEQNLKDKKTLSDALAILQGRDPATLAFIDSMKKYVESNMPLLETIKIEVIPTVRRLDKFLDKQPL